MSNDIALDKSTFLNEYWQQKPLLIKQALPEFDSPLSANELAALAMEEDIESRLILETPTQKKPWLLKHGPFTEKELTSLPATHWTLLVQGVDKLIPEVTHLLDAFDFIPPWRLDDVMISIAGLHGSVGPHYDNYDVFLYQASGQRKWSLTTKDCNEKNTVAGLDLRIMAAFEVEQEFILEPGDMLYLPAHVGHHGVSLSDDCMTYSFGYRSYQAQELWDSFGEYLSEKCLATSLYQDPNWNGLPHSAEIPVDAYKNAQQLMRKMLDDEQQLQHWFSQFATQLDNQAMQSLTLPLTNAEAGDSVTFHHELTSSRGLSREPNCRIAYHQMNDKIHLFINGEDWPLNDVSDTLVKLVAGSRFIALEQLMPLLNTQGDNEFIYELYKQQYLEIS